MAEWLEASGRKNHVSGIKQKMKLQFELVPDSCWYSNLRSLLTPEQWDHVRKKAYARAGGKCMICGAPTTRLEAHEQWAYDDVTHTQSLQNVIAVCRACHECIHIGRTQLMGREREASEHFMKVNACNYAAYRKALGEANALHRERSRVEWQLDISRLKDFI
jgi:hypothetical protein